MRGCGRGSAIGSLASLGFLDLRGNSLSGCVPAELLTVDILHFDRGLPYCAATVASVSDGIAFEDDDAVVFNVTVALPQSVGTPPTSPEVALDYTTVAGTAAAGSDYTAVSGTLTIPAGSRRATVAVPLRDDTRAESTEAFTLRLSNPRGAVLAAREATATIVDDSGSPDPAAPVTVCDRAAVTASVGDVYEVEQSRFDGWHHVFVDVDLTCGDLASGVGYPTAVSVIYGPADSIGASRYCITQTGTQQTAASVAAAAGCRTLASPAPTKFTRDGRSTHLLWIPDAAVGQHHQMRAWVDADRDGVLDGGERHVTFESNFANRTLTDTGFHDYEYPQDFEVDLVSGSTRVGRGGHDTELRLRLLNLTDPSFVYLGGGRPTLVYPPVTHAPVGATIISGPSRTQPIACFDTARSAPRPPTVRSACVTDDLGEIIVRYKVPFDAIDLFAMQQDLIRVHIDDNRNGQLDTTPYHTALEPVAHTRAPIAKAVNYIALGDSYSAGENGETPTSGAYQRGVSDADGECRRWDQAYPYIFAREFLGNDDLAIDVTFATFACTGAITHNIHNPADPDGASTDSDAHDTDRPSPAARLDEPVTERKSPRGPLVVVHERDPRWEPRQAVSLDDAQAELDRNRQNVDMITLTVGGNDAGFGGTIRSCATVGCGEVGSEVFEEVRGRVTAVLLYLKSVAPSASVFVLGYPAVTPTFEGCSVASAEEIETYERTGLSGAFLSYRLSSECVEAIREYVEWIRDCTALDGGEALHAVTGFAGVVLDAAAFLFSENLRIDASLSPVHSDAERGR